MQITNRPATELRLALAMRGGVSLAVWMGGACGEIDELRRGENEFWNSLVRACGYERVVVDVLAGASAGGLNAVLFAGALRHGFKMVELLEVWGELASVDKIHRTQGPWLSIFAGDWKFLDPLAKVLRERIAASGTTISQQYIDLQLTATLVEPLRIPSHVLRDERLWRLKSDARFHFRYEGRGAAPRDDLRGDEASLWRLAVAGRSTSSFPFAFEPALVRSSRPKTFGQSAQSGASRLVDCRDVFSDCRGPAMNGADSEFVVADGGILDNIPIGRAIEAIAASPASGPTRRVLVYLHPTGPPAPPADPVSRTDRPAGAAGGEGTRGVRSVARALWTTKVQAETIDDDLDELRAFNRAVRTTRFTRRGVLREEVTSPTTIDAARWSDYVAQRAASDADSVRRLLEDPISVIGSDPFPVTANENRWRAPQSEWTDEERFDFNEKLILALAARLGASVPLNGYGSVFRTDVSALKRVIDLLLEWTRSHRACAATAEAKEALYHQRSLAATIDYVRQLAWVVVTSRSVPPDAAQALDALERLSFVPIDLAEKAVTKGNSVAEYLSVAYRELQRVDDELECRCDGSHPRPMDETFAMFMSETVTRIQLFDTDTGLVDLRDRVADQLVTVVSSMTTAMGSGDHPSEEHPARLLDHLLCTQSEQSVSHRLLSLEMEGLREHVAGGIQGEEARLFRVSAVAETPLATRFAALLEASRERDKAKRDGWVGRANFLRPEVKLAGNDLGSFSAFLDRRWRDNDWMWGRLDAASDMVSLLLDNALSLEQGSDADSGQEVPPAIRELAKLPAGSSLSDVRMELIRIRQEAILAEMLKDPDDLGSYAIGLETPWVHRGWSVTANMYRLGLNSIRVLRHTSKSRFRGALVPLGYLAGALFAAATVPRKRSSTSPFRDADKPGPTDWRS